jgi:anti-sigma factor RsiW
MTDPVREARRMAGLTEGDERALHAYHDGELRGFSRWRFERRLARSAALQRELQGIAELGVLLREREAQAPGPELWERIALRLPAADVRRAAEPEARGRARHLGWLAPLGAAMATLVVAALVAQQWLAPAATPRAGVVRWMDSRGRSVMVLEEDEQNATTVIWLLDGEESVGTAGGGSGVS